MKSKIIPNKGKKLAIRILKENFPIKHLGVQAITAYPEFFDDTLYVIRSDISSAFESITEELANNKVLPRWKSLNAEQYEIVMSEYKAAFNSNKRLSVGPSISPRIYEEYMLANEIPQEMDFSNGTRLYRYVDDMILFNKDATELHKSFDYLEAKLNSMGMYLSGYKTECYSPSEAFNFLGRTFRFKGGERIIKPYFEGFPTIRIVEGNSDVNGGELRVNAKYLNEFFPSAKLIGYLLWAAIETEGKKRKRYKYNIYEGHSKIYTFYLKHIKKVYLSGNVPDTSDAQALLIALLLHIRELEASDKVFPDYVRTMGLDPNKLRDISTDARKNTQYHSLIRKLFKKEYDLRTTFTFFRDLDTWL